MDGFQYPAGGNDENAPRPEPDDALFWAIRACLIRTCSEAHIRAVLVKADMPDAADLLFGFVWPDARVLLDVIALYQQGRSLEAMIVLRSIMPAPLALIARERAEKFAAVLLNRGRRLTTPRRPLVQHAVFAAP